jgi:hypothetical protein
MHDGFVLPHRSRAVQREHPPAAIGVRPVERRRPSLVLHNRPSVGQPELGPAISAVLDEGKIFATGDKAGCQTVGLQEDQVARPLVVECEVVLRMTDGNDASGETNPVQGLRRAGGGVHCGCIVGQLRIARKCVLDVGEDQLLVLLLVMKPQLRHILELRTRRSLRGLEQAHDGVVDISPVGENL